MILGEDNRKAWSTLDVLVMQAYQILETERCSQCGSYVWLCQNDDPILNVKAKKQTCQATAYMKDYGEKHKDDEANGISARPVFYARDDTPLHKFRDRYYESLAESQSTD